jgi:CHAT domain-containing protein
VGTPTLGAASLALALFAAQDCAQWTDTFRSALAQVREGDAAARGVLSASAEALCAECARCDAREVATYYLALEGEARERGLAAEARFGELFAAVQSAGREGLVGPDWARERERILRELRALAGSAASEPDFVPAARALALAARLEVERLSGASAADDAERAERAGEEARAALELYRRAGLVTPRLEPLWLVARLDLAAGRRADARAGFAEVARLAAAVAADDWREHGLRGLVELAREAGDARAQDRLLAELASFRSPRESWPLARDWAARLLAEDHAEEALDFLERTAPGEAAHARDRAEWELCAGAALLRLGDSEAARALLESAAERAPGEVAVLALAQLALEEQRGFEVQALLAAPGRLESLSPAARAEAHRILGEERLRAGDAAGALPELERSLAIAFEWRRSLAGGLDDAQEQDTVLESVFGEWAGLHTLALAAEALRREDRALEALRRIAEGHSLSLREARAGAAGLRARALGRAPGEIGEDDLAAWIGSSELGLVGWVLGADFGVVALAWSGADGSVVAHAARVDVGRAEVAEAARRMREAALAGDGARLAREGHAVRAALLPDSLLAPLLERARRLGRDARLIALVHGPLERLALEALPLEHGGLLDDALVLAALPGLPDARPGNVADAPAQWTLLGAARASEAHAELPGAARELEELGTLHPQAERAAGAEFTRARLAAALASGRALHLATHLVEDEHGELALVADDGLWTTADVRSGAAPSPLIVLTACESAGGAWVDGQGLHGLARALLESGTRALVVTAWPVADEPARAFGVAFHRALLAGAAPARAARDARAALRAAGVPASEWAAFRALAP